METPYEKVIKRIVNIVIDIIVVLILAVSILIVTLSLTSKSSGVPNVFGVAPLSVLTGSMEDTINTGDLIFCEVTMILHMNIRKAILLLSIRISTVNLNSILTELLRLLRMTTLPITEHRVTIRKLTLSPMKNFKLLHQLSPNTQVQRLAAWVTF